MKNTEKIGRRTKKGHNLPHKHKEFGQKSPLPAPPQKETLDPPNSLCLWPLFPSKYRKKAYIKNFEGGGSWGPQNSFCRISSRALFALDREQKRHIKLQHIKLCLVNSVTGLPGQVPGQKVSELQTHPNLHSPI